MKLGNQHKGHALMTTHCIFGETSPGQQDHTIAVVRWGCESSSQSHCWKWWWFHPILVCSVLLLRVYCEGTMLQSSGSVEKKPYNPQSTIQFHHLFSPLFVWLAECRVPGAGHTGVSVACHGEIQDQPIISPFQTFIIMPESSVLPYS